MSKHSNMKGGAPSSSRKKIMGANPTYKASVQKQSRTASSTKPSGKGNDTEEVVGKGSIPEDKPEEDRKTATGSGHYVPNK